MAIGGRMMNQEEDMISKKHQEDNHDDDHENDMVMPGFRFHPTEEELVEFYLRRKVEGKRFNVELITFLDLYRYDPWELPALAAIGEKQWFFYVPRDRKYRNGDRPNRVTTSGYWKATGADRMIRTDNFRSIGLKKTLVFYSGKAPKGIRSSWIMNEYRLPQHETERLQKAEISLCRVYKRTGVAEDHPSLPRSLPITKGISSKASNHHNKQHFSQNSSSFHPFKAQSSHHTNEKFSVSSHSSTTDIAATALSFSNSSYHDIITALQTQTHCNNTTAASSTIFPNDLHRIISSQEAAPDDNIPPNELLNIHNYQPNFSSNYSPNLSATQPEQELQQQLNPQELLAVNSLPEAVQVAFPDRLWEWNAISSEGSKDFTNPFK